LHEEPCGLFERRVAKSDLFASRFFFFEFSIDFFYACCKMMYGSSAVADTVNLGLVKLLLFFRKFHPSLTRDWAFYRKTSFFTQSDSFFA